MLFITQLIYIVDGQEQVFDEFERIAIPAILNYNGRLLLRVRPTANNFIESHIDQPYEIHLVEFDSNQDFEDFMQDEERKKFLHLKNQSIKSSVLIRGALLHGYVGCRLTALGIPKLVKRFRQVALMRASPC